MTALSYWAKSNPLKSRGILAMLHLAIIANTVYLAYLLFQQDYHLSPLWRTPLLIVIALALAFYPFPAWRQKGDTTHYLRQKTFDFLLVVASTAFFVIHLMNIAQQPIAAPANAFTFTARTMALREPIQNNTGSMFKAFRMKIRSSFRESRQLYRIARQEGEISLGASIALIILVILAAFVLGVLVAALSCNLSCSGNESLAIVVLVAGWAWILVLGFLAIRAILRRYTKSQESLIPENPVE
jgi:hypothetical protein